MKYKHISCLLLLLATLCTTSCVEEVDFDNLLGLSSSKLIVTERVDFGGNETKANFSIIASGDWSISGKPDWFNLSTTNGSGNADITIYGDLTAGGCIHHHHHRHRKSFGFCLTFCHTYRDIGQPQQRGGGHAVSGTGQIEHRPQWHKGI